MATATEKRQLPDAVQDAEDFRAMFPAECYEAWTVAGSVRRGKPEVADIEHVIVPAFGEVPGDGIFGEPVRVNLLWRELERLIADGPPEPIDDGMPYEPEEWRLLKAVYTDKNGRDSYRWGEKYRGVLFRGFKHELFTAQPDTYGAILAIRTGPAEYSQQLVTRLLGRGLRQKDGHVEYARGPSTGERIPCPTEERFFELCGVEFVEPGKRGTP